MKYSFIKFTIVLFLSLLITNIANTQNSHYTEAEAKQYANYAKLVGCAQKPLTKNCPKCINPGDGYKFYFFYQTTRINKFDYKFMIHYNDLKKKILITFSGPSVNNHIYIKYIYSAGFSLVKKYRFQVEKEFYQIYFKKIRKILFSKIQKINSSGRKNFETNFIGHSIGASLATLAAFDMQQLKQVKNPKVYSFAPLRLGDATFVALVNSYVTVYRIVKKSDYLVRIPNCYFSPTYKVWRCFNDKIIREFIYKPNFPLKIYVKSYLTYFTKENIVLHKAIMFARKKMNLPKDDQKLNKINKSKRLHKNNKKIKKNLNNKTVNKTVKSLRKEKKKLQKIMEKLNKQIKQSKKNKNRANAKKVKKSSRKITKILKKLNKIKQLSIKIKNPLRKLLNKKNKKLIKEQPKNKKQKAKVLKKLNQFLRKAKNLSNKLNKQLKRIDKKLRIAKETKNEKSKKYKKINDKEKNKDKKSKKEDKKSKNSPIKKIAKKEKTQISNYYIPTYSQIKVYSPIDTYFSFVYYTQPIGYQIFYNDAMTEYTHCQYSNGISQCEKIITLPNEFTVENHLSYFNVNFEKC